MADVLPIVDRVLFLEEGEVAFDGQPGAFATSLLDGNVPFREALPAATLTVRRAEERIRGQGADPPALDVPSARLRLRALRPEMEVQTPEPADPPSCGIILEAKNLVFRYKSDLPDVLDGASVSIERGTVHAIVGGNGSGKSTLLYLLSGVLDPVRGSVKRREDVRTGLLTQHTKALFSADTLFDELMELAELGGYDGARVTQMMDKLGLGALRSRHPYDLSGGETQKAALAKLLLLSPDILLLDEPVKGMDTVSKRELASWFRALRSEGKTIVVVTHDLNFSAEAADTCSLLFDGRIVATDDVRPFFHGTIFYTTDYARVTRGIIPEILSAGDLGRLSKASHER